MQAKHILGFFVGFCSWSPSKKPREIADYVFSRHTKITLQTFRISSIQYIYTVLFVCRSPFLIWQIFLGGGGGTGKCER